MHVYAAIGSVGLLHDLPDTLSRSSARGGSSEATQMGAWLWPSLRCFYYSLISPTLYIRHESVETS